MRTRKNKWGVPSGQDGGDRKRIVTAMCQEGLTGGRHEITKRVSLLREKQQVTKVKGVPKETTKGTKKATKDRKKKRESVRKLHKGNVAFRALLKKQEGGENKKGKKVKKKRVSSQETFIRVEARNLRQQESAGGCRRLARKEKERKKVFRGKGTADKVYPGGKNL